MDISQFSKRCVFIAPQKNDYVMSQTHQDELKERLEYEFTKLKESGIEVVLCIGGLDLDYKRYDVSHIIPCVMIYHTAFQYLEEVPSFYDITSEAFVEEINLVNDKYTFLESLIYNDEYKQALAKLEETYGYSMDGEELNIDVKPKLLSKFGGVNLLYNWLKEQKVVATFTNQKQSKELKRAFDSNKTGLKLDIHLSDTKHYLCNQLTREDIIFR